MKHSLLNLTLLTFSILGIVACQNSNSTSTDPAIRALPFDNTVFLSIPHTEGHSQLRRKLLNQALNDELKLHKELNATVEIKAEDTFKFEEDTYKLPPPTMAEYKYFKENSAELIVSYVDHLEVYFVPTGISREKAFRQLNLSPVSDSRFIWVATPDIFLEKEKTYYLVSTTSQELKDNDIYFNSAHKDLGSDFNEKYFSFSSNQIINLRVKAEYFVKETAYSTLRGRKVNCSRDLMEAGACGACEYKMETTTGAVVSKQLATSELVDLEILINGRSYPLVELRPSKDKQGNFIVTLDLKKIVDTDLATVEFRQNAQYPVLKNVTGFNYNSNCISQSHSNTIDLTPALKIDLGMEILGRKF